MKKIDSISDGGLVLFVDETKRGATTKGTQEDCLQYAYTYKSGDCYAFTVANEITPAKNLNSNNEFEVKSFVRGNNNIVKAGTNNVLNGDRHTTSEQANFSILHGNGSYSENFGEMSYSANLIQNRGRYTILQFSGFTSDDTETEIFIGGRKDHRFHPNNFYATAYFIQSNSVALCSNEGLMWSQSNFQAFRNIAGHFTEVGNHTPTQLRDAALNYSLELQMVDNTLGHDYLKVMVTGEVGDDVYWDTTLKITEVRIPEILAANSILNPNFLGSPTWQKINQDTNNIITIPYDATTGGGKMVGNGARNLAMRYTPLVWGTNLWKITFDLKQIPYTDVTIDYIELKVQVRVNNQNSQVFTDEGTHSYYVNTVGGANFIQFMINSTTGAGGCIINNVKAQIVTY